MRFEDIGGLEDAKRAINEAVILPLLMPEFFVGLRSFGKFVTWGEGAKLFNFGRFPGGVVDEAQDCTQHGLSMETIDK